MQRIHRKFRNLIDCGALLDLEYGPAIDGTSSQHAYSRAGYNIGAGSNDAYSLLMIDRHWFVKELESKGQDVFTLKFQFREHVHNCLEIIDKLKAFEPDLSVFMYEDYYFKLTSSELFIFVMFHGNDWNLIVTGDRARLLEMKEKFGKDQTKVQLSWWYKTDEGYFDDRQMEFVFNQVAKDEYYPYITEGLDSYLKAYVESPASILVMMGEAGTGKTSFLKHFIKEFKLNTMVTYDSSVMESDFFYIQYLTDTHRQLLVIEDADLLLSSREDDNKTMSKLLNLSDGLIKINDKKIIFTTNLTNIQKVDHALIRPGRCFDVIEFRKLTYPEAVRACEVAGIAPVSEDKEYCLSEIFNRKQLSAYRSKLGFTR